MNLSLPDMLFDIYSWKISGVGKCEKWTKYPKYQSGAKWSPRGTFMSYALALVPARSALSHLRDLKWSPWSVLEPNHARREPGHTLGPDFSRTFWLYVTIIYRQHKFLYFKNAKIKKSSLISRFFCFIQEWPTVFDLSGRRSSYSFFYRIYDVYDFDGAPGIARSMPGTPVLPSACKLNGP